MNNKLILFSMLALTAALAGCKDQTVQIQNGQLPQEMVEAAKGYMGTYEAEDENDGSFSQASPKGQITLSIDSSNHVNVVSTVSLLGRRCQATVGDLQSVFVEGNGNGGVKIASATFALNKASDCYNVEGNTITFSQNGHYFGASIVLEQAQAVSRSASGNGEVLNWKLTPQ